MKKIKAEPKLVVFFLLVLALFLFIDVDDFCARDTIAHLNAHYFLLYFITYLGLVFSAYVFLLAKSRVVRYSFLVLLFIALAFSIGSKLVVHEGYNVDEASIMIEDMQWAGGEAKLYFVQFIEALGASLVIVGIIAYISVKWVGTKNRKKPMLFSGFFIGCQALIVFKTQALISVFPCVFNVPMVSLYTYLAIFMPHHHMGARNKPVINPVNKGFAQHIIFLVDESVRGDALTINDENVLTTPFLKEIAGSYYNYGIASSVANLSLSSNMILQSGVTSAQIPDDKYYWANNPNLFQYARKAGYKTFYIDGQMRLNHPQNGMTLFDFQSIDKHIQVLDISHMSDYESDYKAIDYLDSIVNLDCNTFTYVNKFGAHVPYQVRYPPSAEVFKRAAKENEMGYKDRQTLLNTYYNAIRWSVDGFFEKLIPTLKNKDVVIIYCSDHGQSLMDKGEPGYIGHGQYLNPPSAQAAIPLLIFPFGKSRDMVDGLDSNYAHNKNHASAFQLFPSLLLMMGYSHADIVKKYGITLFDRVDTVKRKFESGIIFYLQDQHLNNFYFADTLK